MPVGTLEEKLSSSVQRFEVKISESDVIMGSR